MTLRPVALLLALTLAACSTPAPVIGIGPVTPATTLDLGNRSDVVCDVYRGRALLATVPPGEWVSMPNLAGSRVALTAHCGEDRFDAEVDLGGVDCRKVEMEELCRASDAIFIHAPANEETHHMLNAECFAQMEKCPFVINTARAPLIHTEALVAALQQGQVRGAGLDLVEGEQLPVDHPLLHFDNVVITPHVAWYSEDSKVSLRQRATQEIIRVLQGGKPRSLLNPEAVPK